MPDPHAPLSRRTILKALAASTGSALGLRAALGTAQDDEPVLWDFGSAARHHQIYCPWLGERSRAGISTLRGATHPGSGMAHDVAKKIKIELDKRKLLNEPVGVDDLGVLPGGIIGGTVDETTSGATSLRRARRASAGTPRRTRDGADHRRHNQKIPAARPITAAATRAVHTQ